jgi:hypothetical protein
MFDLTLPLSQIETTRNRFTRLLLTPGRVKTTEMFICGKILTTSSNLLPNHTLTVTHF